MAEKLKPTAEIHQLKPRKAKGAGGAKGVKSAGRLRPTAHEAPKPPTPIKPSGADPTPQEQRQAVIDRITALTTQHREIDNRMDAASAVVDDIRASRKELRTAIGNVGVPLAVFDERYTALKLKTRRTDLEKRDYWHDLLSEAFGQPRGAQPELAFDKLPEAVKPAVHWRSVGYQMGILGEQYVVPEGCPPEAINEVSAGWTDGQTVIARGMAANKAAPAPTPAILLPEGEAEPRPDWSEWGSDHHDWSDEAKDAFQVWYLALDPELEPAVDHAGVMARIAYLDDLRPEEEGGTPKADDFEAAPEELAVQTDRKIVQAQRGEPETFS